MAVRLVESGGNRLVEGGGDRLLELLFVAAPSRVASWFEPVPVQFVEQRVLVGFDPVPVGGTL